MPTYTVRVEETYDQRVEEILVAFRPYYIIRVVEVEAENEEEARELALDEMGNVIEEYTDYGEFYDSEFYDYGDVIDEDYVETNVGIIEVENEENEEEDRTALMPTDYTLRFRGYVPTTTKVQKKPEPIWEI